MKSRSHLSLFKSASLLAVAMAATAPAYAQDASTAASSQDDAGEAPVIVVTGSRIDTSGFTDPTPTVHVTTEALSVGQRANVAAALNDLPQFRATTSPQTTGTNTSAGSAPVDLRGLGISRTLVLMDGRRFSSENDLNTIPTIMISGVDVVTGGASAAWGSGAVAGVVNIGIDQNFEGLQLGAETGVSDYGDATEYRFDGRFGTSFAGGRGHFVIGGEYYDNAGVIPKVSRENIGRWSTFNGAITGNVGYATMAYGGVITSGVLAGNSFNPDGTLSPFDTSTKVGSYGIGSQFPSNDDLSPLVTPQRRYSGLASLSYEVTPSITATAQMRYSRSYNNYIWFGDNIQGTASSGLWIKADNAFLSDDIKSALADAGQTGFYMGRYNNDLSYSTIDFQRDTYQGTFALDGRLGSNFRWSAYYSHGEYREDMDTPGFRLTQNFANAVDAVVDPVTGNAVCRIALTDPSTSCVPLNLFGEGSPSQEAIDYVTGTPHSHSVTKLDVGGISLRGEPFVLPAGPVSIAIGAEARRESIRRTVGALDAAKAYTTFSFSAMSGSFTVKEAFAEVAVPLIHDTPLLRQFEVNGAARVSDYSTTGSIWSWKLGATNEFFPGLRGRITRSRDIRSANLSELYTQATTGYNNLVNPWTGATEYVLNNGGGNPDLRPETADTWTFGLTFSPPSMPRLSMSLDYFNIDIDDVITTIAAQDLVNRCYNGNADLCTHVERAGDGSITRTVSTYVNLSNYKTDGIDGQIAYVLPLEDIGAGPGRVRFSVVGTWVNSLTTNDGISKIEYVESQGYSFGLGVPRWRVNGTIGYEDSAFSGLVRARYISPGDYNSTVNISNNHIGAYTYFDLQMRYRVPTGSGPDMEIYGNISNLFNKEPPVGSLYSPYYDVIGRYFSIGARITM